MGPSVIDIRKLYADTGRFTYDPGYTSTASCTSKITYIDGEEGVLLHRGYPIEELATKSDFLEVAYLIMFGELPTAAQKAKFVHGVTYHTMVHEQIMLSVPRLPARRPSDGGDDRGGRRAVRLLPRGPRHRGSAQPHDRELPAGRQGADHRRDGLQVLGRPAVHVSAQRSDLRREFSAHDVRRAVRAYKPNPVLAKALDRIFILHADHEQNASTSTVRLVGSTGASPYAAIAAGIASLWGPAHGGANEAVVSMLSRRSARSSASRSSSRAPRTATTRSA